MHLHQALVTGAASLCTPKQVKCTNNPFNERHDGIEAIPRHNLNVHKTAVPVGASLKMTKVEEAKRAGGIHFVRTDIGNSHDFSSEAGNYCNKNL
jgi:hypothetical protein